MVWKLNHVADTYIPTVPKRMSVQLVIRRATRKLSQPDLYISGPPIVHVVSAISFPAPSPATASDIHWLARTLAMVAAKYPSRSR